MQLKKLSKRFNADWEFVSKRCVDEPECCAQFVGVSTCDGVPVSIPDIAYLTLSIAGQTNCLPLCGVPMTKPGSYSVVLQPFFNPTPGIGDVFATYAKPFPISAGVSICNGSLFDFYNGIPLGGHLLHSGVSDFTGCNIQFAGGPPFGCILGDVHPWQVRGYPIATLACLENHRVRLTAEMKTYVFVDDVLADVPNVSYRIATGGYDPAGFGCSGAIVNHDGVLPSLECGTEYVGPGCLCGPATWEFSV